MSYSFNWDCTLPIENIHDIVSINIVPETKAYNEGDYLSIRGHILIEGEYVSSVGNQSDFSESIPLDITLPNNVECEIAASLVNKTGACSAGVSTTSSTNDGIESKSYPTILKFNSKQSFSSSSIS